MSTDGPTPPISSGFGASGLLLGGTEIARENPAATDRTVGVLTTTGIDEVGQAIAGAVAAQDQWARTPIDQRLSKLRGAADAVAATADELAPLLAAESGKPVTDSAGEMGFAAAFLNWVCDHAEVACQTTEIDDDAGRIRIAREPYGVVAAIVPWNAPLILSALKVAPALATGNAIVVKPSPLAPFAVTAALQVIAAHLPPGLVTVLHGGPDVGEALLTHPDIAKIGFTGGEQVARSVLRSAAEVLTPTVLELGGNDPAVLLHDLELTDEVMARFVFGSLLTAGQVCMAAKRIYVPNARLAEFTEKFANTSERVLLVGDPQDPKTTMGPVSSEAQRNRIVGLLEDARTEGAEVIDLGTKTAGFDPEAGYFISPTMVLGAPADSAIVAQEQFGPTVPILGYDTVDEAVSLANDSELGLASSVWSEDEDRAFDVGQRLEAGMTFINCHNRIGMSFRVPFGGTKKSGFGREFGVAGIAEYLQSHAMHMPASVRGSQGSGSANQYPS